MIRGALRGFPLFADFRDWEIDRVRQSMTELRVPAGTTILRQGAPADNERSSAFLTVAGDVRVERKTADGELLFADVLPPGSLFGVVALLRDHARAATCTAVTDVRLLAIDRRAFHELYDADSKLAVRFKLLVARQLARDLRRANAAVTQRGESA